MAPSAVYKCADGTDFPVTWDNPGDAAKKWRRETEHFARPFMPAEGALFAQEFPNGFRRAFGELGLLPPPLGRAPVLIINGFAYFNVPVESDAEQAARFEAYDRFADGVGGPRAVWEEIALPRVQAVMRQLSELDDTVDPRKLYQQMRYGQASTLLVQEARFAVALGRFCQEQFGDEGVAIAAELTQGYMNMTLEADEALWQLAQMIKTSDELRKAIAGDHIGMTTLQADRSFWSSFQDYLETYGGRSGHWQLHSPTWHEHPESILAVALHLADGDSPSPMRMMEVAARRREGLLAELEARLAAAPEKIERLRWHYIQAAEYVPAREAKAYWQLVLFGRARKALLRVGERLVRNARIEDPEDVLFLTPDEIDGSSRSDMRSQVQHERELWQSRMLLSPPLEIGGEGRGEVVSPASGPSPAGAANEMRGNAASRGVVRARARLIESPEDGRRLGPGEVLVSVLTSPAWTSLFAVAGAVVTEGGGILSHAAIVAREYGIPCVVGVRNATGIIEDGQIVTVDGTKGEVRLGD